MDALQSSAFAQLFIPGAPSMTLSTYDAVVQLIAKIPMVTAFS